MQHRPAVQHPVMQGPLLPDEALRPVSRRSHDLKDARPRRRHDRDDALGVGHDVGPLDCHGLEQIPKRHRLAWIGLDIVQQAPNEATERLVDTARILEASGLVVAAQLRLGGRWPVSGIDGAGG